MVPTLFGITVMVFLIARLAPGRPGQMQIGAGGMSAEEAKAIAEWYERRYGLDLPLYQQYLRWWRGMFTVDVQATAWHGGDALTPVFTWRRADPEYYVRAPDGTWMQLDSPRVSGEIHRAGDTAFAARIVPADLARQPRFEPGYAEPTFALVEGRISPIESLDDVRDDLLTRATVPRTIAVDAPAWTDDAGELFYENPDPADGRPVFHRGRAWFAVTPALPREHWSVLPITDPGLRTKLRGRDVREDAPEYAVPRHAVVRGAIEPLAASWSPGDLTRLVVPASAESPAGLFMQWPGAGELAMVYRQKEPEPALFVEQDGRWHRLIGATRVQPPRAAIFMQSDEEFAARLGAAARDALPAPEHARREPRHAVLRGELLPLDAIPAERQVRRYQREIPVFELTLGESIQTRTTVREELRRRLPITLMISLIAFPLIYAIAIPVGMGMAVKRGRRFDASANVTLLGLWSVPTVLSATLLVGYAAIGGAGVQWFPNNGLSGVGAEAWPFSQWLADRAWHLVLPVFCIVYGGCAYLAKQMRASMLDNFTMDYVRTARAKGVPGRAVVLRHVLRNSLLPIITIFATILPVLIAGSIIIEKIFNIEGMGLMAFRAVQNRDYDVVQALALIAGVLNLAGLLLADIAYAIADPRISYR